MRILTLIFVCLQISLFAQTKMPATTKAAIQTIQKDWKKNNGVISKEVFQMFPLEKISGQYYIHVLAKTNSTISVEDFQNSGWKTGMYFANILSAQMPLNILLNNFSHTQIEYIEVAEKVEPFLDQAISDIRADSVHQGINLPQSYTGKNVLVGVVDWGFDYSHPVFFDTALTNYRVVAAWDQAKKLGTPPAGFSHGVLYSDSAQLLTAEADTFSFVSDYHGTHVAGIAGGAGGGTAFRGVGFESDLLFSQMSGNATYSLDAFQWMYNMSQTLGKRLVINNSYGGYRGNPLDGTSLTSQTIDAFSDSGVVFVFSAGNNGGTNFHIKKDFLADSVRTRIVGFNYASDPDLWGQTINMWGDNGNDFSAKLRILNVSGAFLSQTPLFNTLTAIPFLDTFFLAGSDTIFYRVTTDAAHPLNGKPQMTIDVKNTNANLKVILYSEANSGTVHYYNTRRTIYGGGNTGYGFATFGGGYTAGDNNYGIGHPGVTNSAITIAAHYTNAGIVSFSSYGPRIDGVPKPDVSAPGVNIASALNSFSQTVFTPVATVNFNGKDFDFMRISGTSMSGPMVAGIVSLMLEARPDITPQQVKDLLHETAYEDTYTGVLAGNWNYRWGWGKADAYNAIKGAFTVNVEEVYNESGIQIYPNPSNGILEIKNLPSGSFAVEVYSLDGKLVYSDNQAPRQINISNLQSGMYLMQIHVDGLNEVFKIFIR